MSKKKFGYAAFNRESGEGLKTILMAFAWIALLVLIVITGIHAISIVIVVRHHGSGSGILYMLRVAAPIMTEVFAALTAIGFAVHIWRGAQRWIGLGIEVVWLLFASANLISDFTMEAGGQLDGALGFWIAYGLPISAVISGALFYTMLRASPENARREAEKSAEEDAKESDFAAEQMVLESAEYETIRRRRAWLKRVEALKSEGFDDEEISFMIDNKPELRSLRERVTHERREEGSDQRPAHDAPRHDEGLWRSFQNWLSSRSGQGGTEPAAPRPSPNGRDTEHDTVDPYSGRADF